ncbi:putative RNA helicase SDE3 [Cinnamomum micranthum f. kanehirae]|uniref:Putative RNA helicase SDE3 n=1 Tax=Cinnamomum micranthum f. kanehirae TaxID=337451 RepID=A0A3S3NCW5_9MAGN|nr:putative RNA helicase SDE3 [Cinnamomum micranthum f. kanehirae]
MSWLLDILRCVQRYIYDGNNRNPTPDVSAQKEPARASPPTQPETTPVRVATQTPPPSVSQRNYVDSVRPTTISKPTEKPSGSYATPSNWRPPTNVLPADHIPGEIKHVIEKDQVPQVLKKRISTISNYEDYLGALLYGDNNCLYKGLGENWTPNVSTKKQPARTSPPTQPKTTPARVAAQTPSPSLSQRNSVDSVRPPIISNPPENPSGSYATPSNWRPPNVLPVYHIPGDIKHVIEKDQVPEGLKEHVSPSNYVDYFAALLYAEDYYMEKWSEFLKEFVLSGITLRLREETMSGKPRKSNKTVYMNQMGILECNKEEKKVYVEFDMDSIPERRPFLLAKDYVYVRPSGKTVKPFQSNYADCFAALLYAEDYYMEKEPARASPPTQPETTPVRVATQTPPPSVSQRNYVDSVRPTTISKPTEKPSGSYATPSNWRPPTNVLPADHIPGEIKHVIEKDQVPQVLKKRISTISNYEDYLGALLYGDNNCLYKGLGENRTPNVSTKKQPARTSPPTQPKTTPARVAAQTPSPSLSQRNSVDSVRPPIISNPPENPSGSYATPSNWRPPNVLPVYHIPGDIKHVIEKDQVPEGLKEHVSPSNYVDYFAALLYAEDYYMEKWSEFLEEFVLSGITLRLREETISGKPRKSNKTVYMNQMGILECNEEKKVYVEFDMDSIPERRPFLLAKDYVYVRPSGKTVKPFQGFLSRVEKSKLLLAEFGKDFHAQHSLMNKYDVWFDFNRVCLKRSHQGVAAAVDPSFRGILFPERVSRSRRQIPIFSVPFNRNFDQVEMSAVNQILSLKGPPPYLIVESSLPRSHGIIVEAILQIYRAFKESRILIVAPQNHTCDWLIIRLQEEIPVSEMFRANAAFRERDEVPEDVLSSSLYEGECFTFPPSEDLRKFKVIASTFMSSFRLHGQGIYAGHFSHIFVVDACYATEPETMVTLANLANESTAVVLTGSSEHYARWVRSDIARANGLRRSYFKRLLESEPYKSRDPGFVKEIRVCKSSLPCVVIFLYSRSDESRFSNISCYEVLSQRSSSPARVFEQARSPLRSPSTPSIQPRYAYGSDYWNQATIASVRAESARKSQPKQPEINQNPMRFVTQTHTTPPSVSQKNSVDSVRPSTISIHSTKPSTPSTAVSAKIPISSKGLDSVSHRSSIASICPPSISVLSTKPSAVSSSESAEKPISSNVLGLPKKPSAQKPSALSGSDPPKKPHASSGSDPPKKPNASPGSDPPKRPSGSNVLPVYHIPEDIKHVLEKDQIPEVLKKKHISSSNYADYFAALLYAEDYYEQKWSELLKKFVLSEITLRLHEETISGISRKSNKKVYMNQMGILESNKEEKKVYVVFDMDSIPERRPFLLAKDYVYVRRSGKTVKPFQVSLTNFCSAASEGLKGFLSRVEKSKRFLAEFGKDFHAQHSLMNKYDVWFAFNRVCLKRSHQGVAAAVDPSFRGILFPEPVSRSRRQIPIFTVPFNRNFDQMEMSAVNQILSLKGPPPYLIVESSPLLSSPPRSHGIIVEAVLQIYRTFKESRILIVAPQNRTCDSLIIRLQEEIPVSEMFRANAAFRERDEVPEDVLSSSLYEGECFTCPPSKDLRKFKVTASTFMSSFRLHGQGIYAGHFSHIFVVDACYATEPETMVTLANLANESTAVVLAGSSEHYARWVRSDIARANGLRRSYFKRLLESEPYKSRDPGFVKYL